ncbi:TBC1 domain family member 20 isoform X1 [Schistocerca americana]|uniref:TBC1 domain family member 20 n=1 Tax=Schistocerca piceifrons TaxID=274613 RepID=UPI001F4F1299|nr:TBC1 domain family member 20 isoform X1 [Schistocerca americana]XP_047107459.1 TBC1 domain family member 20 [Schistocerca piceifrons]XP_049951462.1 TBC1 domain family member 20 [Schistocerca serialis cubense]
MSQEIDVNPPVASEDHADNDNDQENIVSNEVDDNLVVPTSVSGAVDEQTTNEDGGPVPVDEETTNEDDNHVQDIAPSDDEEQELTFEEVPVSPVMQEKIKRIEAVLETSRDPKSLKQFALSEGGLVTDEIRRKVWPILVGIDAPSDTELPSQAELESHAEYQQVVLDVNRSLKRFPPGIPYEQRVALQDQLTRLILRVIIRYPHLRYYQGYHDVAVTFLLVVGESVAFKIMEKLSTTHLKDCMAATMEKTSYLLNYIYPLIQRLHPSLCDYLERSEVGTMFCLPWFLTWYGHNLNKYQDVVRLYDFFLASPPLTPLYLAAEIVVYRQDEIFAVDCDMPSIHSLLSQIPDDLPFEELLKKTSDLYLQYPPESIEAEVSERSRRESRPRRSVVPQRPLPPQQFSTLWRWLEWSGVVHQGAPRRKFTMLVVPVVTTLVVIYAYCKAAEAYTFDLVTSIR